MSSDEGSQGGDHFDENDEVEGESSKKTKILIEKNEENIEDVLKGAKHASNEKESEQRRLRLEKKAEEFKAEIKRKERLFKIRFFNFNIKI